MKLDREGEQALNTPLDPPINFHNETICKGTVSEIKILFVNKKHNDYNIGRSFGKRGVPSMPPNYGPKLSSFCTIFGRFDQIACWKFDAPFPWIILDPPICNATNIHHNYH